MVIFNRNNNVVAITNEYEKSHQKLLSSKTLKIAIFIADKIFNQDDYMII